MSIGFDEEFIDGIPREEWLQRSDRIRELAWQNAQETVLDMKLEAKLILPREISGLYPRANEQYTRTFDNLEEEFGDQLPSLFAYAQWVKWVACWDGAHWFRNSIEHGAILDNDYTRSFCSGTGYASKEGWSYTAYNKLAELDHVSVFQAMSEKFGLEKCISDHQILTAIELHWLHLASDSNPDRDKLLEFLYEAGEASALSDGLRMWDEGAKLALEEIEEDQNSKAAISARRALAKTAASARHAQNQATREKVVMRYKAEKGNFQSKDAAAIAFTKDFPFEFSTIRDWLKGA